MRLDHITAEDVDALPLPGGPYNVNCALKTLRRMLHKAEEWGLVAKAPKLKLNKELGRTLRLDQQAEEDSWLLPTACWKEAYGRAKCIALSETLSFSCGTRGCATRKTFFAPASRTSIGTIVCSSYLTARLKMAEGLCHPAIALWNY